ncbi:porin [Urechidicola vernalis]|uniref:Phosphate-selective porin O and P n=1 Tax=Urechidicola vernalis TaxID=3075600 RepID=A0ABU2Y549_9FLAO|nr:hypothetical protein [Urechidicola sp. P050]MDT0552193.1 hypothetical protein [Urechidicola sp. P050]
MRKITLIAALLTSVLITAQTTNNNQKTVDSTFAKNSAQRILAGNINNGVTVGGYGEITYNQPEGKNGEMDVQRLVLLFGYKFNDKVQFITEVEFEHVKEVYVEQAFLQYSLNDNLNVRGGLMLVPMGSINEYHEPTTFNGVERPSIAKSIVPTTWREIGAGIAGRANDISLRYQAYIFNGFNSVNGDKYLGGSNGLRNGRQKGAESNFNTPNLSAKVDYYGIQGLRLGLAGYFGRTQPLEEDEDLAGADVGVSMFGLDAKYKLGRFGARGEVIHTTINDSEDYNSLYGSDLGKTMYGWNVEASYNLLPLIKKQELIAFARYDSYDTNATVEDNITRNLSYDRSEWTVGLSYLVARGAVVKADYQFKENAVENGEVANQFNMGIGVTF